MIKDFLRLCSSSTPIRSRTTRREESSNILSVALNERSRERVKEAVELICSPIIPFRSGAWLMKTFYKYLWKEYPEVIISVLSQESLFFETCQPRVYDYLLVSTASKKDKTLRPGTSDSVLNWEDVDIRHLFEKHREGTVHDTDTPTVQTSVKFLRIEDAARIGMDGIIRPLLMQNPRVDVFSSKAVKAVTQYKWLTFWKIRFCQHAGFYTLFLVAFTFFSTQVAKSSTVCVGELSADYPKHCCFAIMVIYVLKGAHDEFCQLRAFMEDGRVYLYSRIRGVAYYFRSNWKKLDLASCMLLLVFIPVLYLSTCFTSGSMSSDEPRGNSGTALDQALSATLAVEAILVYTKVIHSNHSKYSMRSAVISGLVLCATVSSLRWLGVDGPECCHRLHRLFGAVLLSCRRIRTCPAHPPSTRTRRGRS